MKAETLGYHWNTGSYIFTDIQQSNRAGQGCGDCSKPSGCDTGQKGYGMIHFFYDESGKLEKVILYVNTDKTMKLGIKP